MSEKSSEQRSRQRSRTFEIELSPRTRAAGAAADEPQTYDIAFSSDAPVLRRGWLGNWREILSHEPGSIDMSYLARGAAVLVDHRGDQVGVLHDAKVVGGRGRGAIQFSRNPRGQEIERDVVDKIRRFISVGYLVDRETKTATDAEGVDTYVVDRWVPIEVSVVSTPADVSVGFGRDAARCDPLHSTGVRMNERNVEVESGEAERLAGIRYIVDLNKLNPAVADDFIKRGLTPAEVGREITNGRGRGAHGTLAVASEPLDELDGLSSRDRRSYSYVRAMRVAAGMTAHERSERSEFPDTGGVELEVHTQLAKVRAPSRGGLLLPYDLRSRDERLQQWERQRTLNAGALGKGPESVFEQAGEFIELLRPQSTVVESGARILAGLQGPVGFPKQSSAVTAFWVGENPAADTTDSDLGLGLVLLSQRTLQASTGYTRQLLAQSSVDIEAMVRSDFARVHAIAMDRAAIHGSGVSGQPMGIYLIPGVGATAFGGAVTFAKLIDQQTQVAVANAIAGTCTLITTPAVAGTARKSLEFSVGGAGGRTVWTGNLLDGDVGGFRARSSSNLSTTMNGSADTGGTSHAGIFGNFADSLFGLWASGLELIVDPYRLKKRGIIEVVSFQLCDFMVRHPESFSKATGLTP